MRNNHEVYNTIYILAIQFVTFSFPRPLQPRPKKKKVKVQRPTYRMSDTTIIQQPFAPKRKKDSFTRRGELSRI